MKFLLTLIVIAALIAAALFLTGGIFIGRGEQNALTVNGRSLAKGEICRYLTLQGVKTVGVGAEVGGVTVRVGEGCPMTYKQAAR